MCKELIKNYDKKLSLILLTKGLVNYDNKISLHVPHGCANAFLTLSEDTIVHYYMGDSFSPETYRGIRFDDPAFAVQWPLDPAVISERDLGFPNFVDE